MVRPSQAGIDVAGRHGLGLRVLRRSPDALGERRARPCRQCDPAQVEGLPVQRGERDRQRGVQASPCTSGPRRAPARSTSPSECSRRRSGSSSLRGRSRRRSAGTPARPGRGARRCRPAACRPRPIRRRPTGRRSARRAAPRPAAPGRSRRRAGTWPRTPGRPAPCRPGWPCRRTRTGSTMPHTLKCPST